MVANHVANVTPKAVCRLTQFPYVSAAARNMGINRITLWRVLKGHYPDRGNYADGYRSFVAKQKDVA